MAAVYPRDNESSAFERLDNLCSRYGRDGTRHRAGSYQKSGDVECQSQLVGWPDHIEQSLKPSPQIGNRLFGSRSVANGSNAGPELSGGAPDAVFVLLDDVGHVHVTSHSFSIARDAFNTFIRCLWVPKTYATR